MALLKQYTWEPARPEVGFENMHEARPEELVTMLLDYEAECLEDIRVVNLKLAKYKYQIRDEETVGRLRATKKDITDALAGHTDTIWDRLHEEGDSFQTMLLFGKEPQVELDFSGLTL